MSEQLRGTVLRVFALVIFGFYGVFIKSVVASPTLLLFSLQAVGAAAFGLSAWTGRRSFKISRENWAAVVAASALILAADFFYFYSLKLLPVATAVFIRFIFPLFVLFLAPVFLAERFHYKILSAAMLGFAGLGIILIPRGEIALDWSGALFAIGSATALALFFIFLKKVLRDVPVHTWLFWRFLISGVFLLPFVAEEIASTPQSVLVRLLAFGLLFGVIASILDMEGIKRISAQAASVLGYLEPLLATVYGAVFLGELVSLPTLLGGLLVIASGTLIVRSHVKHG